MAKRKNKRRGDEKARLLDLRASVRGKLETVDHALEEVRKQTTAARANPDDPREFIRAAKDTIGTARHTLEVVKEEIGNAWAGASKAERDGLRMAITNDLSRGIDTQFAKHGPLEDHTVDGLVRYINEQLDALCLPDEIRASLSPDSIRRFAEEKMAQLKSGKVGLLYPDHKLTPGSGDVYPDDWEGHPVLGASYQIPAAYWPWKRLQGCLAGCVNDAIRWRGGQLDPNIRFAHRYQVAADFDDYELPFYLLGGDFLKELEETDMQVDKMRLLEEAPLPFPAFMLLFPAGSLNLGVGEGLRDIRAVLVGIVTNMDGRKGLYFGAISEMPDGRLDANQEFSTTLGFRDDGSLIDTREEIEPTPASEGSMSPEALDTAMTATLQLGKLVSKILAVMAAEPKLVEATRVESVRPAKKGKRRLEFRKPRVIGWRVKYVKVDYTRHRRSPGEPIRPHWRRPHVRRVPYGPLSVPLEDRPTRLRRIPRKRVNSEYDTKDES